MRTRAALLGLALTVGAGSAGIRPIPAQQVVQLPAADRPLGWTAPEVFTVGDDEVRAEEQFSRITATAFDTRDNLYVLDGDVGRIAVFDRTGTLVRQFGRKGEGPGELRFPAAMAVTVDGLVVVLDPGNRALVVYDLDGKYQRNLPIDRAIGIGGRFLTAHPKGGVVFALNPGVSIVGGAPQIDTSGVRVFWQRSLEEGAEPVLLYTVKEPGDAAPTRVERSGNSVMMMRTAPPAFTPRLHFGITGDGSLAFNRSADYELHVVTRPGAIAHALVRPIRPRKVTEADKEMERKRRLDAMRSGSGPTIVVGGGGGGGVRPAISQERLREAQEEGLRNLQFAETMPVIQGLLTDPGGRLWIWRAGPSAGNPPVIDIVDAAGRYAGTVSGLAFPSAVSNSGLASYSTMNELDVPVVVVRRVPQA